MGREIKRVSINFQWPLNKTWPGYLNPWYKFSYDCETCKGNGYSKRAKELGDMWYGYAPFDPTSTGSKPFGSDHPIVRERAHRNMFFMKYGTDWDKWNKHKDTMPVNEKDIAHEARRLSETCFDNHWMHHLSQEDVDALWEEGRLDFKEKPTASEVNEWSIGGGMGHDSINNWICVKARCKREEVTDTCPDCKGEGSVWAEDKYRVLSEQWENIEPPEGDAYQLWETTSEGSPISPPFETPEELAKWLADTGASSFGRNTETYETWLNFIRGPGWSPTMIMTGDKIESGVAVATEEV